MPTPILTAVPDYYSEQYHYERFPAKIAGRPGHFAVWSRTADHVNPDHVTWSPETVALVSEDYRTPAWHAERAERAARPELAVGDTVQLGDVTIVVPVRAGQNVTGVPCQVVSPLDRTAAVNRARVALAHLARTDAGNDPNPADVLAFAEAATEGQWRDVEALAGRPPLRKASPGTRAATLTVLAQRAIEVDDPFASFGR